MLENPATSSSKFSSLMINSSMERSSYVAPPPTLPMQKSPPENVCTLPKNRY